MKILIGLSGGVDSAVAAYLLKKQGHDVIGVTMSIWDKSYIIKDSCKTNNSCFGPEEDDIKSADKVAKFLKIPLYILNNSKRYKKIVIKNFIDEYINGRTPNPCILCNAYVKFKIIEIMTKKLGINFDKFATGHYANIKFNKQLGIYQLLKSIDKSKDQTYFLYRLSQKILSKTIFPIGKYTKFQIRNIAKKINLPVADKHDSQNFYCGNYRDILNLKPNIGNLIDKYGKILGKHHGIWNYTIGTRKGLGLGGMKKALYVVKILTDKNIVIVGEKKDLYSSSLIADKIFWGYTTLKNTIKVTAKIRQQHKYAKAIINKINKNEIKVEFYKPQISVTPGQSIVFYKNNTVIGGGIIKNNLY
jgi:tRNA-specific 2-thiouridylase